jgi:hypothetical protein
LKKLVKIVTDAGEEVSEDEPAAEDAERAGGRHVRLRPHPDEKHSGEDGPLQEGRAGVYVMVPIFCDFRQISAKKWAFFFKTNVMIKILHNLALF